MPRSKIIKELVNNDVDLIVAVRRLLVLASDIQNEQIIQWANKELNGYEAQDCLPQYRIFKNCELRYTGLNGSYKITKAPLPKTWLRPETLNRIATNRVIYPLSEIESYAKSNQLLTIDRTEFAGEVEERTNDGYVGVHCLKIEQVIPTALFARIVNSIYNVTLRSLIELDKTYGCLDELDIGSEKIKNRDLQQFLNSINIIFEHIKIKDSNIGEGSNSLQRTTSVEVSPQISLEKEGKKKGGLHKLFKK